MGFQHLDTSFAYADMRVLFSQDLQVIESAFEGYSPISGGDVVAGTTTGTVKVNAGVDLNNSVEVTVSAQDNIALTADASLPRFAYIEVDSSGTAQVNAGTAAVSPVPPTPTSGRVVHALIYMLANTTGTVADLLWTTANGNKKIIDRRCMRTSMDVQLFTATGSNTWTKMPGIRYVLVTCISGGGGGGSGSRVANTATAAHGGAGGGSGGVAQAWVPAALLGSTESLQVGLGGAGGTARASNGNGNAGTNGTSSFFGTGAFCTASQGLGGAGGATGGAAGGTSGGGNVAGGQTLGAPGGGTSYAILGRKGGTGADGTGSTAAVAGAFDGVGPGAGGGGGGMSAAAALIAAAAGANGPAVGTFNAGSIGGAVTNATSATAGNSGAGQGATWLNQVYGGGGGSGGNAANVANTTGGVGGAGGAFGGGGGGGGSGVSTGNGAAGGTGGNGAVLVIGFA